MQQPAIETAAGRPAVAFLTLQAGTDKLGRPEALESVTVEAGRSLALVGPTGSGKSELLSDIEQWADRDTVTGRRLSLSPGDFDQRDLAGLVARLSQKTSFVMDASVDAFLRMHAECRGRDDARAAARALDAANSLCGEPILPGSSLQVLSGGQSRALMIADIAFISDAPVVLIDEIENAGIDKFKALEILNASDKPIIVATHDPILMLMAPSRLVMKDGGMSRLIETGPEERERLAGLARMDQALCRARDLIREGKILEQGEPQP